MLRSYSITLSLILALLFSSCSSSNKNIIAKHKRIPSENLIHMQNRPLNYGDVYKASPKIAPQKAIIQLPKEQNKKFFSNIFLDKKERQEVVIIDEVATNNITQIKNNNKKLTKKEKQKKQILIQIGSYSKKENAKFMVKNLKKYGASKITPITHSNKTLYRVTLGPIKNKITAKKLQKTLAKNGFNKTIIIIK